MSSPPTTDMEKALRDFVVFGTGLPDGSVFWKDQGSTAVARPYAALKLADYGRNGQDWYSVEDNPLDFVDVTVVPDNTDDTLAATAHGLQSGDGPVRLVTAGTPPTGLLEGVDYWVIRIDANTIKLAATLALSTAGTPLTFSDDGVGAQAIVATDTTTRVLEGILYTTQGERVMALQVECFGGPGVGETSPAGRLSRLLAAIDHPIIADALEEAGVGILRAGRITTVGGQRDKLFEPRALVTIQLATTSELQTTGNFIERMRGETDPPGSNEFEVVLPP